MKRALITGASGGIGRSLALKLMTEYELIIVARNENGLKTVQEDIEAAGGKVEIIMADLTLQKDRQRVYKNVPVGSVDLLINNAGVGGQSRFAKQDPDKVQKIIDLNISALTEICRHYTPAMKRSQAVINVASVVGFLPFPFISVYAATKAYVLSFSEALSEELKKEGVHVMALCPGATRTGFEAAADMQNSSVYSSKIPGPDEVADYAINALRRRKVVAIHGIQNNALVFLATRLLPRKIVRLVTHRIMSRSST